MSKYQVRQQESYIYVCIYNSLAFHILDWVHKFFCNSRVKITNFHNFPGFYKPTLEGIS